MLQLSLFEPLTKLELSRLEVLQGRSVSRLQLRKLGLYIPGSSGLKKRLRVCDRLDLGYSIVKTRVAVNDNGRAIGEDHARAKYLDKDVEHALELRAEGYTLREISRMLDMPIRTIRGYLDGSRRSQSVAGWKMVKRWIKG
jgi:hypothetical protein